MGEVGATPFVVRSARGLSDIVTKRPITPATVFRIGSISKQFTAPAVLQLAAEGKLKLEDPITTYLQPYPNGAAMTIKTVAQLYFGHSGLYGNSGLVGRSEHQSTLHDRTTDSVFKDLPLLSEPGEKWAYDISGYVLLGALIEAVTHKPWYQAVDEQIVPPLGLSTIRYGFDESRIPAVATG